MPNVSMLPHIGENYLMDMNEITFWECATIAIARYRSKTRSQRKAYFDKIRRERK